MSTPYVVKWYPDDKPQGQVKTFVEGLSKQCRAKYDKLRYQLSFRGPSLNKSEMLDHVSGDVLELRDLCDSGALRIYLFRDGIHFYLVNGEIKNNGRNRANPALVRKAQECCDEHKGSK